MELRTLKDFEELDNKDCRLRFNLLRQEAVKWVKELPHLITKEDWFNFFNITEEDLK